MKQGSANMWWIIIGAVVALVVMVVLMVIFTGKSNTLEIGLLDCASKGGTCKEAAACTASGGSVSSAFTCSDEAESCCFEGKKLKSRGEECTKNSDCLSNNCKILGSGQPGTCEG